MEPSLEIQHCGCFHKTETLSGARRYLHSWSCGHWHYPGLGKKYGFALFTMLVIEKWWLEITYI